MTSSVQLGRWGASSFKPVVLSGSALRLSAPGTKMPLLTHDQMKRASSFLKRALAQVVNSEHSVDAGRNF